MNFKSEYRQFPILSSSPALHFYLLQFVSFGYILFRFLSRNYTVYGLIPKELFNYPRSNFLELWPTPILEWTTFQFIYEFIDRPDAEGIFIIQLFVISFAILGLIGLFPKLSAIICFTLASHVTGMVQSSNAEIDGGTLALVALLVLAISPRSAFYRINKFTPSERSPNYQWPIFILFLLVGYYYSFAGINKIIDVGPHWPFVLNLENLALRGIENSLFISNRYVNPAISSLHLSPLFSDVAGVFTLIGELFFICILFIPRSRLFLVFTMISLHVLVYLMAGINFIGSSFILLLCFDYNIIMRNIEVYYDGNCAFCIKWLSRIKRVDNLNRIHITSSLNQGQIPQEIDQIRLLTEMGAKDENGEIYYGADAFEQVFARIPVLIPIAILLKVPGVILIARYIYKIIAKNRQQLGCKLD